MKKIYSQQNIEFGKILILSVLIGGIVGSLDALFGEILISLSDFRAEHFMYLIPFLPIVGVLFSYFFYKYGGNSQQGMNLIFQAGHEELEKIPLRLIPFVIIGTWLTHLFGGSAGREGVAVQLGGTVANWFSRKCKLEKQAGHLVIIGMAAGFAGLFGTPIAATFFAIEVLTVGKMRYQALLPAMLAAFTASSVTKYLGLEKFTFPLTTSLEMTFPLFIQLIVIGIIFALAGSLFADLLEKTKVFFADKFTNPLIKIGIGGIALSILLILAHQGRYAGLGTNLIAASFADEKIYIYDWLLKILLTILTISIGFLGGEVTPLFAIGSTLGVLLAEITGLPIFFVAALGYASVFGSATSTLLAPIFIGGEVFGFQNLPYFFVVCSVAYFFSQNKSIYPFQK
ncbi:H+/Cl- antiporter ClcA [Enterococcus sp. PF1-24]|uniref:chloride channel protein n=1 Tax=unclassified Enterococcus TaxID=2608891 RepID=UPI0024736CE5|nr:MULTISPECIES: chloride channel protein [unclassified Enterococcus]MDH6363757.1 H+/Cl- antiporter ClcA [Enterococcus sp. PFB1-1]MDH6400713.1 H+/Cl- antiporter ClcA [Enterococcus sp. PF1-24]